MSEDGLKQTVDLQILQNNSITIPHPLYRSSGELCFSCARKRDVPYRFVKHYTFVLPCGKF